MGLIALIVAWVIIGGVVYDLAADRTRRARGKG
ncbi:hypothetical protein BCF33_2532 [Hasllibacter halocynthiae]|uniref:Uncharacterized protein n=1 Tax=Hasllibacter halocynthiae TaxID=595589 RepID=A0A2T0X3Y3_9RHOB|nr:hypothetical protein BCF33_2532 [Hasllibacter halocynthiae]